MKQVYLLDVTLTDGTTHFVRSAFLEDAEFLQLTNYLNLCVAGGSGLTTFSLKPQLSTIPLGFDGILALLEQNLSITNNAAQNTIDTNN